MMICCCHAHHHHVRFPSKLFLIFTKEKRELSAYLFSLEDCLFKTRIMVFVYSIFNDQTTYQS